MTARVRPATPGDALAIAQLHIASWRATYHELPPAYLDTLDATARARRWVDHLAQGAGPLLVLEADGVVVGFCAAGPTEGAERALGEWQVRNLHMHPTWRGRGGGRVLLRAALAPAVAAGVQRVMLWVVAANAGARRFYERVGMAPAGAEAVRELEPGVTLREIAYSAPLATVQANLGDASPTVAVVGAGAVGLFFGGLLARAHVPVTFIGRERSVAALQAGGLRIIHRQWDETFPVSATADPARVAGADLVLLCVKSRDTEGACAGMQPHLAPHATVVSLQNGVDNPERAARELGRAVLGAAVYVGAQMDAPNVVRHLGRGELGIGQVRGSPPAPAGALALEAIAALWQRAGVPCTTSSDVEAELWRKLVINCAYNAISATTRATYGEMMQHEAVRALMDAAALETIAVAAAQGIRIDEGPMLEAMRKVGPAMPDQFSSTAQDLMAGKPTEIDALNGLVARRGAALGVPVPVNTTLATLVSLAEVARSRHT